jgi:hypothetical protein
MPVLRRSASRGPRSAGARQRGRVGVATARTKASKPAGRRGHEPARASVAGAEACAGRRAARGWRRRRAGRAVSSPTHSGELALEDVEASSSSWWTCSGVWSPAGAGRLEQREGAVGARAPRCGCGHAVAQEPDVGHDGVCPGSLVNSDSDLIPPNRSYVKRARRSSPPFSFAVLTLVGEGGRGRARPRADDAPRAARDLGGLGQPVVRRAQAPGRAAATCTPTQHAGAHARAHALHADRRAAARRCATWLAEPSAFTRIQCEPIVRLLAAEYVDPEVLERVAGRAARADRESYASARRGRGGRARAARTASAC